LIGVATTRKPKGSYSRNTPDWFVDNACVVAGAFSNVGTGDVAFDLFNNSNVGEYLHVYRLYVFNDAQGEWGWDAINGHAGTFVTNGFAVLDSGRQMPGALYQSVQTSLFSTDTPFPPTAQGARGWVGDETGTLPDIGFDAPIQIISPGNSMRVRTRISSFFGSLGLSATFFYVVQRSIY
jgi:hypothetical protein